MRTTVLIKGIIRSTHPFYGMAASNAGDGGRKGENSEAEGEESGGNKVGAFPTLNIKIYCTSIFYGVPYYLFFV